MLVAWQATQTWTTRAATIYDARNIPTTIGQATLKDCEVEDYEFEDNLEISNQPAAASVV